MATQPSPDRSVLEAKTREDLQTIARAQGVAVSARASKTALIEAITAGAGSGSASTTANPPANPPASPPTTAPSRVVRSRRTVATPDDDFADLLGEFATVAAETAPSVAGNGAHRDGPSATASTSAASRDATAPSPASATPVAATATSVIDAPERPTPTAPRPSSRNDRQPRDLTSDVNGRSRRNRRNRTGRERFGGEMQPNADQPYAGELIEISGLLDLRDDGYGFLRTKGFHPAPTDVYVSINQVRRYHLRKGDVLVGGYRPAASNEKYPALLRVDSVQGLDPEVARLRPRFEDLTPLFPDEKLRLETNEGKTDLTPRIVDLLAPIGKGQRGLIVSPPKAGKTTVMKQIAQSIEANNPEVHLMVLLVDERPEEVTDMRRSVSGEVIASTFDRPAEDHTHIAELAIERAKRLVEQGRDVVIILDGITRLARAYNLAAPATGRIMSGGVDSGALYPPKKFFGAARNIEEGGSLTILATALVETGSKMDEVIFEEFKGTGNMELKLDRRLAERRLYPAIDVNGSSTRHEELLFAREMLPQVWKLRRVLNGLASEGRDAAGLELLIDKLKSTRSNDEFLSEIARGPNPTS